MVCAEALADIAHRPLELGADGVAGPGRSRRYLTHQGGRLVDDGSVDDFVRHARVSPSGRAAGPPDLGRLCLRRAWSGVASDNPQERPAGEKLIESG